MPGQAWLQVPLADYEAHMRAEQVAQLHVLSDLFAEALAACKPASVAILGIAGGNGLERIDPGVTTRVVGVDICPGYLDAVRQRYGGFAGLELCCVDLAEENVPALPVDLVHAALVFEHAGAGRSLDSAIDLVRPGGSLSVVLQLPSTQEAAIGSTGVAAMQVLAADFRLFDPVWLTAQIARRGLVLRSETSRPVAAGKALWMGTFQGLAPGR